MSDLPKMMSKREIELEELEEAKYVQSLRDDIDIPLAKLYPLFPAQPIFGQKRPKNKKGKYSHWLVFMKVEDIAE